MLIGALFGLLVFASGPTPSSLLPTPSPVSDKLTVIMCGAVLGESFDRTRARLGEPTSKAAASDRLAWVYTIDRGRADCVFSIVDSRVIDIFVSSVKGQPDPQMIDPYGVELGTSDRDLIAKRGDPRFDNDEEDTGDVYPSQSGACWAYTFGYGEHKGDVIVTSIRVYLDLGNPRLDCFTR